MERKFPVRNFRKGAFHSTKSLKFRKFPVTNETEDNFARYTAKRKMWECFNEVINKISLNCFLLESEIPEVAISQVGILEHGNDVSISCNLTERGSQKDTKLVNISLIKNGVLNRRVNVSHHPLNSTTLLGPVVLKTVGVNDGGIYTCRLDVLLKNKRPYEVTDSTLVRSKCIRLILYRYLTIIPWARVGYEMIDSQRGA